MANVHEVQLMGASRAQLAGEFSVKNRLHSARVCAYYMNMPEATASPANPTSTRMRKAVLARWARSTPEQRAEIARKAAVARWANKTPAERIAERAKGRAS